MFSNRAKKVFSSSFTLQDTSTKIVFTFQLKKTASWKLLLLLSETFPKTFSLSALHSSDCGGLSCGYRDHALKGKSHASPFIAECIIN